MSAKYSRLWTSLSTLANNRIAYRPSGLIKQSIQGTTNMPGQPIETGDKLHIMTRRLFLDDIRRHFAGEVVSCSDGLFELRGYAFVYNIGSDKYQKRTELRTRIFSFNDGIHVINKLPREVVIDSIHYNTIEGRIIVTDLKSLALDINEFGLNS